MQEQNFMGLDGFVWFTGVVEDRNDPESLGRVRVRCVGYHTEDLNDIPTSSLPWATVMSPTTTPSMQGLGVTPSFLVEGSWVVGFFADAGEKQQPIIIGSLPGVPQDSPDYTVGFNDPRSPYKKQQPIIIGSLPGKSNERPDPTKGFNDPRSAGSPQDYYAGTPTYGPYPLTRKLNEPDTNRLARGEVSEKHLQLRKRRANRQTGVETATQPFIPSVSDSSVQETRGSFDEPHPRDVDYNSVDNDFEGIYRSGLYPYNHTFESESGHITEVDDTPGAERTLKQHRTGTYEEVIADGTKTTKVIGNNFEIIMNDSNVYIGGSVNLTIGGTVRHLIKGDYHLEVEGNYTQKIHKNMRTRIGASLPGGNLEEVISGTHSYNITGSVKGRIAKDVNVTTEGNEQRINNGTYDLITKGDIFAVSNTGGITLNASTNFAIDTTTSGITIKSGTTFGIRSATLMTIASETTIDMDATTEVDIDSAIINLN